MEDEQILKLFLIRSEDAIIELSQKYAPLCRKISRNILSNKEDIEESISDTYFALWNSIPPNEPKSLCNYLCTTLRNIATKKFHYNTAEKRNSSYDIALEELSNCLTSADTVETTLSAKELGEHINEFLAELDLDTRTIFVLRYWCGESVTNIAKKYNLKQNTVSTKLMRTREQLRTHLVLKGVNL